MFGTEIESAYSGASYSAEPSIRAEPSMSTPLPSKPAPPPSYDRERDEIEAVRMESARQEAARHLAREQELAPEVGFQLSDAAIADQRIKMLEHALAQKQALEAGSSSMGLFERYASKRRDVFKLLIMALTVLLALSTHHAITDLIRNYLNNNDVARSRETLVRFGYPALVLALLWSLKVFNK